MKKTEILKVLVGSHAHGLANPDSDYDYRGVYVVPTREILSLGFKYSGSHWLEGETEDNTAYEIGHFLHLATKCNPTILEVFQAPEKFRYMNNLTDWGKKLKELFPYVWNPKDAYNAFVGYGLNQRKKMLDNHLERWNKYATAYLRTLWNLGDLLATGTFSLEVKDALLKERLLSIRNTPENWTPGKVIDIADILTERAKKYLETCNHEPNLDKVNEFLLEIRQEFWE